MRAGKPHNPAPALQAWGKKGNENLPRGLSPQSAKRTPSNSRGGCVELKVMMMTSETFKAVKHQLDAMGGNLFEVGVRRADGRMLLREWAPDAVLKAVRWLQHENAQGADVYIRPARSRGSALVLVDDLSRERIAGLPAAGLAPCVVVETSKENFQAWIHLTLDAQPPAVRTAVAWHLATILDGDLRSADYAHFGRLAGLTNRKTSRMVNGKHPFARLVLADAGQFAEKGDQLVRESLQLIAQRAISKPKLVPATPPHQSTSGPRADKQASAAASAELAMGEASEPYKRLLDDLAQRYGASLDASRADWMCALSLFSRGYAFEQIANAMQQHSPGLAGRKGDIDDYLVRTIGKAEIWNELRRQGCSYDDVREDLLTLARQRGAERRAPKAA